MIQQIRREQFIRRPDGKGTPCPSLLWFFIRSASDKEYWPCELLRTIANSPSPFRQKHPDLKEALKALGLEWLKPSQISRIRECPAPDHEVPRRRFERWISLREPLERSPRCKKLFWAWRGDQKTCDLHLNYASMFRVQKHRKAKQKHADKLRQLKQARAQLKRIRRRKKRDQKLAQADQSLPLTSSLLQAKSERADLQLLKLIRLGFEPEPSDSARLGAMIRDGYVLRDKAESQTYKLSGTGLQLLGELKKRVSHALER